MKKEIIDFLKGPKAEFLRYMFIGIFTSLIDYVSYHILYHTFHVNISVSNVISIILAIIFAYVANKIFVFQTHCKTQKALIIEAASFFASRLFTMVLEVVGVELFVNVLQWNADLGKIISQIVVIIMNYIFSKFIVFKKGKHNS